MDSRDDRANEKVGSFPFPRAQARTQNSGKNIGLYLCSNGERETPNVALIESSRKPTSREKIRYTQAIDDHNVCCSQGERF